MQVGDMSHVDDDVGFTSRSQKTCWYYLADPPSSPFTIVYGMQLPSNLKQRNSAGKGGSLPMRLDQLTLMSPPAARPMSYVLSYLALRMNAHSSRQICWELPNAAHYAAGAGNMPALRALGIAFAQHPLLLLKLLANTLKVSNNVRAGGGGAGLA